MTWTSFHRRGEILRDVIASANRRRDGRLPSDLPGVAKTFVDERELLGALQLRWHTRLAGRIERELAAQPMELEDAVVAAWHATAAELPGVRMVLDQERVAPRSAEVAEAMAKATAKERILLAMMAGGVSAPDDTAVRVGARIEERARLSYRPAPPDAAPEQSPGLLGRLKAALVA